MKIDLSELLQKVGNEAEVEQEEKVSFPEDNLILSKPVKIKVHMVNTGSSVLLNGKVETEAEIECSRCLKTFRLPLELDIKEEYSKHPYIPKGAKEIELREEDFISPIEKDNSIDLTELVRQDILLALPIKNLCSPDCKGVQEEEGK